jgi:hypothetical protein
MTAASADSRARDGRCDELTPITPVIDDHSATIEIQTGGHGRTLMRHHRRTKFRKPYRSLIGLLYSHALMPAYKKSAAATAPITKSHATLYFAAFEAIAG